MGAAWHFPQVFDLAKTWRRQDHFANGTTYLLPDRPPISQGPSGGSVNFPRFLTTGTGIGFRLEITSVQEQCREVRLATGATGRSVDHESRLRGVSRCQHNVRNASGTGGKFSRPAVPWLERSDWAGWHVRRESVSQRSRRRLSARSKWGFRATRSAVSPSRTAGPTWRKPSPPARSWGFITGSRTPPTCR